MHFMELLFISPFNLVKVVLFYIGVRCYFHFKPNIGVARSLVASLGFSAYLPLAKAHLENSPLVYVTISTMVFSIFVVVLFLDIRAFVRRRTFPPMEKRPSPSIFFLSDVLLVLALALFMLTHWRQVGT